MEKNEYFIGKCTGYTHEGLGIVRYSDTVVFVKGMLQDEIGQVKIIKILKNYAIGRLINLTITSKERVEPRCIVASTCGGCQIQHMSSKEQQRFKTDKVSETLKRIGGIDVEVSPCMTDVKPWNYRNKGQIPIGKVDYEIVSGFYKKHSHEIIPIEQCLIQSVTGNKLVQVVVEWMKTYQISAYNEETQKGLIRHVLTKYAHYTQESMLVLIATSKHIPHYLELEEMVTKQFPSLKTIVINVNDQPVNKVLGDIEIIKYGQGYIEDMLLGNRYQISARSFYQINPIQTEHLYTKAIELANLSKEDQVLDLYCGIGTITLSLAKYVRKVIGVEVVEQSIIDANNNKAINKIDNVEFICDDATKFMQSFNQKIDVIFVDPPRKGLSSEIVEHMIKLEPSKIIYISCDVATLARDLKVFSEFYDIKHVQPIDMFPHTFHVETVVLMSSKKRKKTR